MDLDMAAEYFPLKAVDNGSRIFDRFDGSSNSSHKERKSAWWSLRIGKSACEFLFFFFLSTNLITIIIATLLVTISPPPMIGYCFCT